MTPNLPLLSWMPDADPTTPGIITDLSAMLPTKRGYAPDYTLAAGSAYFQVLPSICKGAALVRQSGNFEPIVLLSTQSDIYAAQSGVLLSLTRAGTPYTAVTDINDDGWRFGSFGDEALAVSLNNALQRSASPEAGTRFTNISGAPTGAGTMATSSNFVVLGNITDPAHPYGDGYWTSGLQNVATWTPDIATFASQGRLRQTPGNIVRLIAFGDDIIAFKASSIIRGTFTGDPSVPWAWRVLSVQTGIACHDAVVEADGVLYWLARDGFYAFNGAQIRRLDSAPFEWFQARAGNVDGEFRALAQWDSVRRVVRWYYVPFLDSAVSGVFSGGVAYHPATDRWGSFSAPACAVFVAPQDSVPTLTSEARTRHLVPMVVGGYDYQLKAFRGPAADSTFNTNVVGDDERVTVLTGVRARLTGSPITSICLPRYRMTLDDLATPWTIGDAVLRTADGRYDFSHSARWHMLEFRHSGMYELYGFRMEIPAAGKR